MSRSDFPEGRSFYAEDPISIGHDFKPGASMALVQRVPGQPDELRPVTLIRASRHRDRWLVKMRSGMREWVAVEHLRRMKPETK